MKKLFFLIMCVLYTINMNAQTPTQKGYVKTIGRPNKPGVMLGGVMIRLRGEMNAVVTRETGEFHLPMARKKEGDAIVLVSVQKSGYELKDRGLIGRSQVFSTKVPLEILMVDLKQLEADKRRIEANAYHVAETNYKKKVKVLEQQRDEGAITAETYRTELSDLQQKYENYMSLIGDMADRYARTDYDQLDSLDREINLCIEEGELDKADSLIHTVFDPETVLERNRAAKEEIRLRIEFAQSVIDKANADKAAILRDLEYAKRVILLSENLIQEYLAQGEKEKALDCLEKVLGIQKIIYGEDSESVRQTQQQIEELKK